MLFEDIILTVRGQKVILDYDLARIYGVPTTRLNEQVRRNADRFPSDFIFQLTLEEAANLRSQIATSSLQHVTVESIPGAKTRTGATALMQQGQVYTLHIRGGHSKPKRGPSYNVKIA